MEIVKKDVTYYKESGGGLTVTGGEPFMQPLFLEEVLRMAKDADIHTCVERCGYVKKAY